MNHLPGQHTNLGRVLRAMANAGPMTAGHIRRKAGLHPDTAVTARIRDLRKMGCVVPSVSQPHPTDEHKRVWYYQITYMPRVLRDELRRERERMASMGRVA